MRPNKRPALPVRAQTLFDPQLKTTAWHCVHLASLVLSAHACCLIFKPFLQAGRTPAGYSMRPAAANPLGGLPATTLQAQQAFLNQVVMQQLLLLQQRNPGLGGQPLTPQVLLWLPAPSCSALFLCSNP